MKHLIRSTLKALTLMPILAFAVPGNAPSPQTAIQYIRVGQCEQEYVVVIVTTPNSTDAKLFIGNYTQKAFERDYGQISQISTKYNLIVNCV